MVGACVALPAALRHPPCQAAPPDLLLCLAYTPSAHNGCRVQCSWACRCATQLAVALSVKSARQLATLHARLLPRCSDPQTPRTRTPTHTIARPRRQVGGGGCLWSGSVWDLPHPPARAAPVLSTTCSLRHLRRSCGSRVFTPHWPRAPRPSPKRRQVFSAPAYPAKDRAWSCKPCACSRRAGSLRAPAGGAVLRLD